MLAKRLKNGSFLTVLVLFVIFCPSIQQSGIIYFPSNSIVCQPDGTECEPTLKVTAAVSAQGSNWEIEIQLPSTAIFPGPNNTVYGGNGEENVYFYYRLLNSTMSIPLSFVGNFPVLTVATLNNFGSTCPPGWYCCVNSQSNQPFAFQLQTVSSYPTYQVFEPIGLTSFDFLASVNLVTTNSTFSVVLSQSNPNGVFPPPDVSETAVISSSITAMAFNTPNLPQFIYLVVDPTGAVSPFLAPSYFFSPGNINSMGITQAAFAQAMSSGQCSLSHAQSLLPTSSSPNPFSQFFSQTISAYLPMQGLWYNKTKLDPNFPIPSFDFVASQAITYLFDSYINTTSYQLVLVYATPSIVGSGSTVYQNQLTIFMSIENSGRTPGYVYVIPSDCCYSTTGTNQALSCFQLFQPTGVMLDPSTFSPVVFTTNLDFSGTSGYCTFNVYSEVSQQIRYEIAFQVPSNGTSSNPPPSFSNNPPTASLPSCTYPSQPVSLDGVIVCQSPCTVDQVWNNSTMVCDPVNCTIKYLGQRDWFNPATNICRPYPVGATPPSTSFPSSIGPTAAAAPEVTLDCGNHGIFDPIHDTCICYPGYYTSSQPGSSNFQYCDTPIATPLPTRVYSNPPSKYQINYAALIASLACILFVAIVVTVITYKCLKLRASRAKKKKDSSSSSSSSTSSSTSSSDSSDDSDGDHEKKAVGTPSTNNKAKMNELHIEGSEDGTTAPGHS